MADPALLVGADNVQSAIGRGVATEGVTRTLPRLAAGLLLAGLLLAGLLRGAFLLGHC